MSPGGSSRKLQKLSIKNLKQFPDGIRDKIVVSQISVRESQDSATVDIQKRSHGIVVEEDIGDVSL